MGDLERIGTVPQTCIPSRVISPNAQKANATSVDDISGLISYLRGRLLYI